MISPKLSETLKYSNVTYKSSRKRLRSCNKLNSIVPKRQKFDDFEICNIEVIANNEEAEEHIIIIKKEPDDSHTQREVECVKSSSLSYYDKKTKSVGILSDRENKEKKGEPICQRLEGPQDEGNIYLCPKSEIIEGIVEWKSCPEVDIKLNYGRNSTNNENIMDRKVDPEKLQWVEKLKIPERCQVPQHFLVDEFDEVKKIMATYEHETFTRLLVTDVNGGFKRKKAKYSGEAVHFKEKGKQELLLNGTPFSILGRLTFRCHQGNLNKRNDKEAKRNQKYGPERKRYRKFTISKKKNCPFKINVLKLLVFPDFNVDKIKDSPSKLYKISSYIKKNREKINFIVKYIFTLPSIFEHENHQLGEESVAREAVDKRVFDKVEEYVRNGITKAMVVKDLLKSYIQYDLEVDPSQWERRKYNPSLKDIRAKIYRTVCDMKGKLGLNKNNGKRKPALIKCEEQIEVATSAFTDSQREDQTLHYQTLTTVAKPETQEEHLFVYEPNMQPQDVTVDLSEGNVHHEEMVSIDSIIEVRDDDNELSHGKAISDNISKLNLLSMVLKENNLIELCNDIGNVISKWRPVWDAVCENPHSDLQPKVKTKQTSNCHPIKEKLLSRGHEDG